MTIATMHRKDTGPYPRTYCSILPARRLSQLSYLAPSSCYSLTPASSRSDLLSLTNLLLCLGPSFSSKLILVGDFNVNNSSFQLNTQLSSLMSLLSLLDIVEKCQPDVVKFNFHSCDINDHGIESAVTTFINQANTLNSSKSCFRLHFSDPGITYNGIRSLTKLMRTKNISLIEFVLQSKIDFITLNLLIGAVPTSSITTLGLISLGSPLTSRHIYHLVLLFYQARHLQVLYLSEHSMQAESFPLLLMAARNVERLTFTNILSDQHLQEIGPILQSNTSLNVLDIVNYPPFKQYMYSFESLCEFIKVITAPESRSQLRSLVTEYAEDIYANKELMTAVKKFGESRGYPLIFSTANQQIERKLMMGLKNLHSLPESLITGRT